MISRFNNIHQLQTYDSAFLREIISWFSQNNTDTVVILWNIQNEIVYVSPHLEEYISVNVNELIGKNWALIFPKQKVNYIQNHFESSTEKLYLSNILFENEENNFTFEGIVDFIEINEESYYICKLKNNTYVNELKKVILDTEKLMLASRLSAGLVHEIRNPLTSLKGFLQLVQAGVEQKEEYYRVMIGEIEKLEKITSELLHMAQPLKNIKQDESIHDLIQDVVFMMSTQIDMRDVRFNVNTDKKLTCFCNASQIKQVLFNIVKNGAEAMNKSGLLTINAYKKENDIVIEIIDDGPGMSDEVVQELNNPFFTTKSDGSGLGLMITQHIIEMHNGQLDIMSKISSGSIFTIMLPISN